MITRKFLSWDDNTRIDLGNSCDSKLYEEEVVSPKEPCVWPFERLNVDTLGRIALCGQDIGFQTADQFPTVYEKTLKEIWLGDEFNWYRKKHVAGEGGDCFPCKGCSAWKAGVRDWNYGWLTVLDKVDTKRVKRKRGHLNILQNDVGAEVQTY